MMSPDETRRLLAVASSLKVRTLLSLGYGCGLRASEVFRYERREEYTCGSSDSDASIRRSRQTLQKCTARGSAL